MSDGNRINPQQFMWVLSDDPVSDFGTKIEIRNKYITHVVCHVQYREDAEYICELHNEQWKLRSDKK